MAHFSSIPELIQAYQERFIPSQAEGADGVVQLNLSGPDGGNYFLVIQDATLDIHEGIHPAPTVAVASSAEDWLRINNGEANPMVLMMQGKVKVSGSIPMATRFQSMFRRS